jgi:glycosyltransferase involved in cell wall biosynthesis
LSAQSPAATPPLRITIVTSFFLPVPAVRGGASERAWHGLAGIFAAQGHSVTFFSRGWPGFAAQEEVDGVRLIRLPGFDHSRNLPINLILDFIWGIRVTRALPAGDVVICNSVSLPAWLPFVKRSAGKVTVMMGRAPKGQVSFYRGVSRIYAPSTFVARQITPKWASGRTRVIGYPIDWQSQAQSAAQSGPPVKIGFVGRLHPEKGIAVLVRASRLLAGRAGLPQWRLKIVGPAAVADGGGGSDWVEALKSEAGPAGEFIEWLGPEFDSARLAKLYGTFDIFCYPSLAEKGETFGVAVAEAMAARCAVVVSALGCFSDLVTDGQTGLVFDHAASDPAQRLADCIGRLLADVRLRKDLAVRGQQHARRFDYPEVSRLILEDLALLTGAQQENHR